MGSSFSLNISFFIEKQIIEINNEINIAIINFRFLFYGGTLQKVS